MLIEPDQLRDAHGVQRELRRPLQAFDRHFHPPCKDVLEPPVTLLNGLRPQFVEALAHVHAVIAVGRGAVVAWSPAPSPAGGTPDAVRKRCNGYRPTYSAPPHGARYSQSSLASSAAAQQATVPASDDLEAPLCPQQRTQRLGKLGLLVQKRQQGIGRREVAHNHDDERFHDEPSAYVLGGPCGRFGSSGDYGNRSISRTRLTMTLGCRSISVLPSCR